MEKLYEPEDLSKWLHENGADFSEVYQKGGLTGDPNTITTVSVTWGDWKHSHGWLDHLMRLRGYKKIKEVVTESDGSDTYSADHIYSLEF